MDKTIIDKLEKEMQCNCDLPELDTGHSWVCRIHETFKAMQEYDKQL